MVLAILLSLPESLYGWIVISIGVALRVGVPLAAQVQVCSHVSPEELRLVLASMLTVMPEALARWNLLQWQVNYCFYWN